MLHNGREILVGLILGKRELPWWLTAVFHVVTLPLCQTRCLRERLPAGFVLICNGVCAFPPPADTGTLGCAVARCLVGWGVQHITFADNGRVAYSNPVRQSLFTFEDCKGGGKFKATAAAAALSTVYPGAKSAGHVLTIPMPGHPLTSPAEVAAAKRDAETLEQLVSSHDVVFILTDSRESRWLPTLLAAKHDKICINAALGLDSFLVVRHGGTPATSVGGGLEAGTGGAGPPADVPQSAVPAAEELKPPGLDAADGAGATTVEPTATARCRLGCYFCTDVVAPENSSLNRTLDQQCTVTRPGLAPMAAATAVELTVGLLHHPLRQRASADDSAGRAKGLGAAQAAASAAAQGGHPLGALPHQVGQNRCTSVSLLFLVARLLRQQGHFQKLPAQMSTALHVAVR